MKPKIEQSVPVPKKTSSEEWRALLKSMKVGDSIVVPKAQRSQWKMRAFYVGVQIATRKESATEVRLWRVK